MLFTPDIIRRQHLHLGHILWPFFTRGVAPAECSVCLFCRILSGAFICTLVTFCALFATRGVGGCPLGGVVGAPPQLPSAVPNSPSRPPHRLLSRMSFGLSRSRRPARFGFNAGVAPAECSVCCLRRILSGMWYHLWLLGGVSSIESEFYSGLRLLLCGMLFRGYFFYFYLRMSFFCCTFAPQTRAGVSA